MCFCRSKVELHAVLSASGAFFGSASIVLRGRWSRVLKVLRDAAPVAERAEL